MPASMREWAGYNSGEREPAMAMAASAAGMLVITDRGFPGVELGKAYTSFGAHLLLRPARVSPAALSDTCPTALTWPG